MKNIAAVGVLERIRRLAPQGAVPPYRTVEEWREWQLAEGRKRSEEINRLNHQVRVEKILNRAGIQPLHRKCSFGNYRVQNDGQRHALSQAKSIADELMTGCTNFVFSGKPGTGKNHLAAAIGNRLMAKGRSVIIVTVSDVMSVLHDGYDNGQSRVTGVFATPSLQKAARRLTVKKLCGALSVCADIDRLVKGLSVPKRDSDPWIELKSVVLFLAS